MFKNLESAKTIMEIRKGNEKLEEGLKEIEDKINDFNCLSEEIEKIEVPNVDMIVKLDREDTINQIIVAEDIKYNSVFTDVKEFKRKTEREIEIKRVDGKVVYTSLEDGETYVGEVDLSLYPYEVAVRMAMSKAIIEIEKLKLEKLAIESELIKVANTAKTVCALPIDLGVAGDIVGFTIVKK